MPEFYEDRIELSGLIPIDGEWFIDKETGIKFRIGEDGELETYDEQELHDVVDVSDEHYVDEGGFYDFYE